MLVAGLAGTAVAALAARPAAATTPPTPPTEPPQRPTAGDTQVLGFAQQIELSARDLYQAAIDEGAAGDEDRVLLTCRANHQAVVDALSGLMGRAAPQARDDAIYDEWEARFASSDLEEVAAAGYELENTLVVTHIEAIGQLEGLDGARTIAAALMAESRMCTVLADLSGQGDDLDALFTNSATALTPTES
jgi:hypothetical protein